MEKHDGGDDGGGVSARNFFMYIIIS